MRSYLRLPVLPVNIALVLVALIDLITTVVWLKTGRAIEINPIMASVLRLGIDVFIGVKVGTLAAYILVLEWYRRSRSAALAALIGRITLASYISIYTVSFLLVNGSLIFC
jgi:hypothetical protein